MNECEALNAVPYFRGLRDEIICSILEFSFIKSLPAGGPLFHADETCKYLYIIKKGLIEIFQVSEDGKKLILHHAGKGAFLGDTILFSESKHNANASAREETEVLVVEKKHLEALIFDFPEIAIKMLADFGDRIRNLQSLVAEIALTSVRGRIIRLLLELARDENCSTECNLILKNVPTQDEMACRIGTVREVLCKGLHSLERDQLIKVKRGKIILYDIEKLRDIISFQAPENLFPITLPMKSLTPGGQVPLLSRELA